MSRRLRLDISGNSAFKAIPQGRGIDSGYCAGGRARSWICCRVDCAAFVTRRYIPDDSDFHARARFGLGIAATALLPLQIFVIPRFQKKINALSRTRLKEVRVLGEKIGNISNDNQPGARDIYGSYKRLHDLRLSIHKNKFVMKSLNNFISQMTPFFFYTIGGYLVIKGDLTLGALIAVLTAYKDMGAPLKSSFATIRRKPMLTSDTPKSNLTSQRKSTVRTTGLQM